MKPGALHFCVRHAPHEFAGKFALLTSQSARSRLDYYALFRAGGSCDFRPRNRPRACLLRVIAPNGAKEDRIGQRPGQSAARRCVAPMRSINYNPVVDDTIRGLCIMAITSKR